MDRIFKIHCSAIGEIMGQVGLTEKQKLRLFELATREKALTDLMQLEYDTLMFKRDNPELPETAKTFLQNWYANDQEQIHSKFIDKGNQVEIELIEFMADQLGYGLAEKNLESIEDDYFIGTCDVILQDKIVDVKASWNRKTLQQNVLEPIDRNYSYQGQGYMHLYKKDKFVLFYGLMNTPEDVNFGYEVIYDKMPDKDRCIAYELSFDKEFIDSVIERVKMCREYLIEYDKLVKSKLGKIN